MIETNFKHTEIGLIPHDWEVKSLGSSALIKARIGWQGLTTKEYLDDGPYYLITGADFKDGKIDWSGCHFVTKERYDQDKFIQIKPQDVLVSKDGTIGKVAYLDYIPGEGTLNSGIFVIRSKDNTISQPYLALAFLSRYFDNFIDKIVAGSTIVHLYQKDIVSFAFPVPPTLAEQEKIAGALSSIDTLIGALNEQIEKKRHIKQGTMQQLLTGKKRLAGFTGEWKEVRLGDVAKMNSGGTPTSTNPAYYNGDIPFLSISDMTSSGKYIQSTEKTITQLGLENSSARLFPAGTLMYAMYASIGKCSITNIDTAISQAILGFKLSDALDRDYLYYHFCFIENIVKDMGQTGTQSNLSKKIVEDFELTIPPTIAEQSAIAAVLSGIDTEIAALEQKRDKYIAVKQGMMQQLLTGRIRLLEEETQEKPIVQTIQPLQKQRTANVFFRRSVLAAEIADRLCEKRRFGHVKMEKLIFMTEKMCGIDLASHYHRDAAGPYDNRALRSIDSQLKKQKWFEAKSITDENGNRRYTYMPLANRGGHKQYFDLYYADVLPEFDNVINTMADWDTEHCEIIATLYSAWEDLLHSGNAFTDDDILNELYHRWHDSKKRFSAPRLLSALTWMRQNNFIPKK